MYHASYAYPSEIVPFVELALTLLFGGLVLANPRRLAGWAARAWQAAARITPRRASLGCGVVALAASLATMALLGFPVSHVSDEDGYLLLADTFAHGRLANPSPAVAAAFENVYVLVRPTYASKYPPVQGAILAVGQLLGHPGLGVSLSVGLLAASCCWFLQGWLPAPWPLAGALLAALRIGLGSYWGQSYWGGIIAAVGGMLLYGALPRLGRDDPDAPPAPWLALASGCFLLANTRPLEGAVAALPAAAVFVARTLPAWRRAWRPLLVPLTLGLGAAAAMTAVYDRAVTGDPLRLPYQLHDATYGVQVPNPFVAPPPPVVYSSPALAAHLGKRFPPTTPTVALARGAGHFARMAWFACGLPLLAGAVLALRRPDAWRLFALACVILPAAVHAATPYWSPHYAAAATGPLLLLGCLGLRDLAESSPRGREGGGPVLPIAALAVGLVVALVELPAHRPDAGDWSRLRARLGRELAAQPAPALVVVGNRVRAVHEWVTNPADLSTARVLWIQDLGPDVTRQVAAAYAPRRIWRLDSDLPGDTPHLVAWAPDGR